MAKVAVLTNAFQELKLIQGCIKQFKPFKLFHVVVCPNKSWHGNYIQDNTPAMANKYGADLVVEGDFETEKQQFNYGLNLLHDYDWVIICDADERYLEDDIRKLLETFENSQGNAIRTATMPVYWKSRDYEITPNQTDGPLIAVQPTVVFEDARRPVDSTVNYSWVPIPMYHFSYVRNDKDMLKKIKTFSHADEFNLDSWYENVWKKWTPAMKNLHPVVPPQFASAIYSPAPFEIVL